MFLFVPSNKQNNDIIVCQLSCNNLKCGFLFILVFSRARPSYRDQYRAYCVFVACASVYVFMHIQIVPFFVTIQVFGSQSGFSDGWRDSFHSSTFFPTHQSTSQDHINQLQFHLCLSQIYSPSFLLCSLIPTLWSLLPRLPAQIF